MGLWEGSSYVCDVVQSTPPSNLLVQPPGSEGWKPTSLRPFHNIRLEEFSVPPSPLPPLFVLFFAVSFSPPFSFCCLFFHFDLLKFYFVCFFFFMCISVVSFCG